MKKLIKIFLICTLVFLALCITVSAETEGNFTYTVSGENGIYYVTTAEVDASFITSAANIL